MPTPRLHWTAGLHHDGSALHVSNPLPALGETVFVRLRAPLNAPIRAVFLRTAPDGEGHLEPMEIIERDSVSAWWSAPLQVSMPRNHYRFKIISDEGAYFFNALGASRADSPDGFDFKLLADYTAPLWLEHTVFYQIFPDRFYNGDPDNNVAPGAWSADGHSVQFRPWGEDPLPWKAGGSVDFFGGDLPGIVHKLDYLRDLGVNALYLNPIFPSPSNHRYNIDDFFNVDRYLGGNRALIELRRALDRAGMRLMLDVTPNHTSSTHTWFTEAQQDANAPSADYYTFYQRPDNYLAWFDVPTLPKLNYASDRLHEVMYRGQGSVLRHWLREPYRSDGWRLDVYNMTARQGSLQLGHEVTRGMRQAVKEENPEAYLLGEHFYDGSPHLQGDELDATMNYQGFNIPLWRWLAGYDNWADWRPETVDGVLLPAEAFAEQLARFRAAIPWVIARQQFNQLGNHDTRRILDIVGGDRSLARLGAAMLMTYPGVPCVYYGDEIGLRGRGDPYNRRCMPWDESLWDTELRDYYRQVVRLRRTAPALIRGGFQELYADGGLWMFQRQSPEQQLIVIGYRGPDDLTEVTLPLWHAGIEDGVELADLLGSAGFTVRDGGITLPELTTGSALILEAR
jgi:alpha-glucosidase